MSTQTNEQAFEATIEKYLTGTCLEEIKDAGTSIDATRQQQIHAYQTGNPMGAGYYTGNTSDYDPQFAIDTKLFWQFLHDTQAEELAKLQNQSDWQRKILERFDRIVKKEGLLYLFKKGLSVDNARFELLYPPPLKSSAKSIHEDYAKNVFSVTRQVKYNTLNQRQEIDMVLFINGLPVVTMELKNHWTNQTARVDGQKQWKYNRDQNQPLLQFARALVHFAVDTDEVYMTTRLQGAKTFFLPFNKGTGTGAGNPVNPQGHKTAYLWEEVFQKDSLVNIILQFMRLSGEQKEKDINKKILFFPRYHQMDVVRKLIADTQQHGTGKTYLIQHSAGSGKSNSITWLGYQLIEVYIDDSDNNTSGLPKPLFDTVVVVTDRRMLDKQIKDNIKAFSEMKGVVAHAGKAQDLKTALQEGKRIVITTLQKFPFILDGIDDLSDKNFAIIIDEAHSSQGGSAAAKMNEALGNNINDDDNASEDDTLDHQEKILNIIKARKMKQNASYFAFTATPKNSTLEKFGEQQADGSFKPFHLYSMKQAIQEGFILDVLSNYTTYQSFYEITKSIEENPLYDPAKAQKKIRGKIEREPTAIAARAEIMLNHFMDNVFKKKQLKGKAKGMVITSSIESAIKYYQAIKKLLDKANNPFDVIVAFSGTKTIDGVEYSEADLNGFSIADTKEMFDKNYIGDKKPTGVDEDKYRLLIVADKYLTGFDQPKLCCMYVDKKLSGVLAVQALSRLNRSADKLGKSKESLFVLDFFNKVEDIKAAFDPYYTTTTLSEATDINILNDLSEALGDEDVYEAHEVSAFAMSYFANVANDELSPLVDISANRFNDELELTDEDKADFKIKAKQFVKVYGQMASLLPYEMVAWEELYWFLKFLIPKLIIQTSESDELDKLLESVDLSTYGLARTKLSSSISLDDSESELDPQNPNPRSAHGGDGEEQSLDEIVKTFNDRWFAGWDATPEDQKAKIVSLQRNMQAHPDFKSNVQDNPDPQTQRIELVKILDDVMRQQRKQEIDLFKLYKTDEQFNSFLIDSMIGLLSKDKLGRMQAK